MANQSSISTIMNAESNSNLVVREQDNAPMERHENVSTRAACLAANGKPFELFELENRLRDGLKSCKIKDVTQLFERMKKTEMRIQQYVDETRNDEAQKERQYLNELKRLQVLREDIVLQSIEFLSKNIDRLEMNELENRLRYGFEKCKIRDMIQIIERIKGAEKRIEQYQDEDRIDAAEQEMRYLRDLQLVQIIISEIFRRKSIELISNNEEKSQRIDLNKLIQALTEIPDCAEKTIMDLLVYFHQRLLGDDISENTLDSIHLRLSKVQTQLQDEELFSEQMKMNFQEVNRTLHNQDCSSTLNNLNKILKKIRPLNLQEIRRHIRRSEQAAALIHDKDIVLLIGVTGSGKSTTVQFLTGAKMKETRIEIDSGKFLEHITIDGPVTNRGLIGVKSSPFSKSETRFLVPVTIPLKDIIGPYETSEIIVCDAPGFCDTEDPELDIANFVGVIAALKGCKSVKILALSSYRSLGDRGEGIQKLTHILINMIYGIQDRLDTILYGFTKYPSQVDIHAILSDIKTSRVDSDPLLRSNSAFVAVLTDMIEKTRNDAMKIDPIDGNPKSIIQKLKDLKSIRYPDEFFQFSISQETQVVISHQTNRYKCSIIYALKHKNVSLLLYYLNQFKMLSDITEQSFVQDGYKDSLRWIIENIQEFCSKVIEQLNRLLKSQDKLKNEDIQEYLMAHNYIQQIQQLRDHLGSNLISADIFIENLRFELENIGVTLDLFNPSIGIYLDNFHFLQNLFQELKFSYLKCCEDLNQRFELTFGQSIVELISKNEFKQLTAVLDQIFQCIPILNDHLNRKIEKKYHEIIKIIIEKFEKISNRSSSLLLKINLTDDDIDNLQNDLFSLKLAKETSLLENQLSKIENMKNLNEIYEELIGKVMKYIDEIILRIKELLDKNGHHSFDSVQQSVHQLELIRTLPDIESKSARSFYQMIQNICLSIQKLQREIEEILHNLNFQSNTINIRPLSRLLLRFKNTQWMDRFSPGNFDMMIRDIREELIEHIEKFESNLRKLNLNLQYPQNIPLAHEILEKIDLMKDLERSLPELQSHRERINEYFLQIIRDNFQSIHQIFNLTENTLDHLKNELKELKEIQTKYDNLYPPIHYLRQSGYLDINQLHDQMKKIKIQHEKEIEEADIEKNRLDFEIKELQSIIQQYEQSIVFKFSRIFGRVMNKITTGSQRTENQFNDYLKEKGYSNITIVKEKFQHVQTNSEQIIQMITINKTDFHRHLTHLQSIEKEYLFLVDEYQPMFLKGIHFLNDQGFETYQLLERKIQEKTNCLSEYEKQKQTYYFHEEFDGLKTNNALIYINHCEKLTHDDIKQIAIDTNEYLKKYLLEYGNFLQKEIERYLKYIMNIDKTDYNNYYSKELEKYFRQLILLEKYSLVFEYLKGREKIAYWQRQFLNYHHSLLHQIEEDKINGRYKDFKHRLTIIQSLICLDQFFTGILEMNKFEISYKQYQLDLIKISEEAYKTSLDAISKEDFTTVDSKLSDIMETVSNSKFISHIKNNLESTLQMMIKNTKVFANSLDKKIEHVKDNQSALEKIVENLEKVQIILHRTNILNLIDQQIKILLQNLSNEIHQILTKQISNILQSIEIFLNEHDFLSIEKTKEYLIRTLQELTNHYRSESIEKNMDDMKKRISQLPNEILQQYDFVDINKYLKDSPRNLFQQLKIVSSNGYPKYTEIYRLLLEKLRINFRLAINNVKGNIAFDRSAKMRTIRDAFYFLPEELKIIFQTDIEEIDQMIRKEVRMPEFD